MLVVLVSPGEEQKDRLTHSVARLGNIQQVSAGIRASSGGTITAGTQGIASSIWKQPANAG
jgi:hypothetical protein